MKEKVKAEGRTTWLLLTTAHLLLLLSSECGGYGRQKGEVDIEIDRQAGRYTEIRSRETKTDRLAYE